MGGAVESGGVAQLLALSICPDSRLRTQSETATLSFSIGGLARPCRKCLLDHDLRPQSETATFSASP
jgi:hypothetical protein